MPNRPISRRLLRLVAAAGKTSETLHRIKKIVDDYLVDGIPAERSLAAVALALTHSDIDELDASVAEFNGGAS